MSVYRLSLPYERPPLRRRVSGLGLAVAVNIGLLLILMTLGRFAPEAKKVSHALVVDFLPESHSAQASAQRQEQRKTVPQKQVHRLPQPPVVLPAKPTISAPPPEPKAPPFIEMSSADLAAADLRNVPKATGGDSDVVGTGPHGEVLYAPEWARHPTRAELSGYLPHNAPDGFGLIACKTIPGDRVDDCVEIDQEPHGSHLASAVRQAAWQFRIRPPRKNGVPMIGAWVGIRIDYESVGRDSGL